MIHSKPAWLAPALIAVFVAAAQAQPERPALEGYRPFADQPVAPWAQTNDTVREVGGWRAYAREAQGPAPAASAAAPASAPRAGHPHHP